MTELERPSVLVELLVYDLVITAGAFALAAGFTSSQLQIALGQVATVLAILAAGTWRLRSSIKERVDKLLESTGDDDRDGGHAGVDVIRTERDMERQSD